MALISIIIPVFNVEKYICRCLDSILNQTFQDFEIIAVDDCSCDSSGQICDQYAARDSRIKVFHKTNGGVSSARNVGLDNALGEWIMFVDADDWIDENTLEICLKNIADADVVRFSVRDIFADFVNERQIEPTENKTELLNRVIARQTIISAWCALYRRTVVGSCRFNTSFNNGEDWLFLCNVLNQSKTVMVLNIALYNYERRNEASCTSNIDYSKIESVFNACATIAQVVDKTYYGKSLALAKADLVCQSVHLGLSYKQLKDLKDKITIGYKYYPVLYLFSGAECKKKIVNVLSCSRLGASLLNLFYRNR